MVVRLSISWGAEGTQVQLHKERVRSSKYPFFGCPRCDHLIKKISDKNNYADQKFNSFHLSVHHIYCDHKTLSTYRTQNVRAEEVCFSGNALITKTQHFYPDTKYLD